MRIAHTGDIHIKANSRHDEYRVVFDNLFRSLREDKPDRILVNGDVFDNKTTLSPEAVDLCYDFFRGLINIAHVDVMIGNHDANLANRSRLTSLHPICKFLEPSGRITLYDKSGLYEIADDVTYGVFCILDDKSEYPIEFEKKAGMAYVALYHGPVIGASFYAGKKIDVAKVSVEDFRMYEQAYLSDIHYRQFVGDAFYIEKTIKDAEAGDYKYERGFEIIGKC